MFPRSPINLNITLGFFLDDLRICSSLFCSISVVVVIFVVNNFKMLTVIISSKLLLPYYLTCFFLRRKWSCILHMCVYPHTLWLAIYLCSLFFRSVQTIEQSSLCYAAGFYYLFYIQYCQSQSSNLSYPPLPLITISFFSISVTLFLFYK